MKIQALLLFITSFSFQIINSQNLAATKRFTTGNQETIFIHAEVPKTYKKDSITLELTAARYKKGADWLKVEEKIKNGRVKWILQNDNPVLISSPGFYAMFEP